MRKSMMMDSAIDDDNDDADDDNDLDDHHGHDDAQEGDAQEGDDHDTPKMDGLCHGKSYRILMTWGYPHFRKPPHGDMAIKDGFS